MTQICFIGGGNMARSLIGGLIARGHQPQQFRVAEPVAVLRDALRADFGVHVHDNNAEAAASAEVIVLAVKPQVIASVCEQLAAVSNGASPLYVSIAAGISHTLYSRWLGPTAALVRAMPNTPALISAGACGLHANASVSVAQRALAAEIMGAVGDTRWIAEESLMDAVTAVSGSGPAYFFLLMEAMIEAGIAEGLDPADARALVLQTALGAARMARESDEAPDALRRRVTSPNGTTQAAIEEFESRDMRGIVAAAIHRATERGRQLAAEFGA